jgi:hypothetical protein
MWTRHRQDSVCSAALGPCPLAAELGVKALRSAKARETAEQHSPSYFRSALAYMLISIPTCTSTICGVFQVIRVLLYHLENRQARQHTGAALIRLENRVFTTLGHLHVVIRRGLANKLAFSVARTGGTDACLSTACHAFPVFDVRTRIADEHATLRHFDCA